jgi:hypothetical protein
MECWSDAVLGLNPIAPILQHTDFYLLPECLNGPLVALRSYLLRVCLRRFSISRSSWRDFSLA